MKKRPSDTRAGGVHREADPLLSVRELCAVLGVPPATIYQLTHRGRIPHFKIANRLRFRQSEILAWIEARRVPPRR
jgi:excisionase family DNA binding protein